MNPEFERNLWLEASPGRIAWAGVALAVIYAITALASARGLGVMAGALSAVGAAVFVACGLIWGARAAGGSVLDEIADRTWDFQRLSALEPWAMTWGKLFGAASLAWLCGLSGLVVMAAGMLWLGARDAITTPLFMAALAVLVQAVCMGAALIGVRKARAEGRAAQSRGVAGGLVIGAVLLFVVATSDGFRHGAPVRDITQLFTAKAPVAWWSLTFPAGSFRLAAAAAFAGWALAGAWRLMRLELQMRSAPVVWPVFLVFLAVFVGGLAYPAAGLAAALLSGALINVVCAYAAAFAEPADRVRLRLFGAAIGHDLDRAVRLAPAAIAPVVLAIVLAVAALGVAPMERGEAGQAWQVAALIAFLVRDLGVIAFHRFGPRPQRGDFGAVLTLALLYLAGSILGSMFGHGGAALFAPVTGPAGLGLASGAVQAVIAWRFAVKRFKAPETSAVSQ